MAKTKEQIRPLYPTIHEYNASLMRVLDEASMLLNAVGSIISFDTELIPPAVAKILKERHDALKEALYERDIP